LEFLSDLFRGFKFPESDKGTSVLHSGISYQLCSDTVSFSTDDLRLGIFLSSLDDILVHLSLLLGDLFLFN